MFCYRHSVLYTRQVTRTFSLSPSIALGSPSPSAMTGSNRSALIPSNKLGQLACAPDAKMSLPAIPKHYNGYFLAA